MTEFHCNRVLQQQSFAGTEFGSDRVLWRQCFTGTVFCSNRVLQQQGLAATGFGSKDVSSPKTWYQEASVELAHSRNQWLADHDQSAIDLGLGPYY